MVSGAHLLLTLLVLYHSRCPIHAHCVDCVSSQVSCCQSLEWIDIVPSVPSWIFGWFTVISPVSLLFTGVASCPVSFHTASYWGGFFVISGVSLPLTFMAQHHIICLTSAHYSGVFTLFYVFHCPSLGWLSIYTSVSLTPFVSFLSHRWFTSAFRVLWGFFASFRVFIDTQVVKWHFNCPLTINNLFFLVSCCHSLRNFSSTQVSYFYYWVCFIFST